MHPQDPRPLRSYEQHRLIERANRYLAMADEARDPLLVDAYRDEANACLRLAQIDGTAPGSPPRIGSS